MATAKKAEKAKEVRHTFSKFLPDSGRFVTLRCKAGGSDDFSVGLEVYDGNDKLSIWLTEWDEREARELLLALQKAANEAVDFHKKALAMPNKWASHEDRDNNLFARITAGRKKKTVKAS